MDPTVRHAEYHVRISNRRKSMGHYNGGPPNFCLKGAKSKETELRYHEESYLISYKKI